MDYQEFRKARKDLLASILQGYASMGTVTQKDVDSALHMAEYAAQRLQFVEKEEATLANVYDNFVHLPTLEERLSEEIPPEEVYPYGTPDEDR